MSLRSSLAAYIVIGLGSQHIATASAQTPVADHQRPIDEIVVTVRKRGEKLRETPVSVTALDEQTIYRAGISDIQELALLSPGLSHREAFGRATGNGNNRPSIRGMSSILGNPNASFFVDGIYVDGPITAYSMENLERVEVIRGPQAATFGRGTFAGAVNFVTRRPDDEKRGRINVEIGDQRYRELSGFWSGPLAEGILAAELNFRYYGLGADPEYPNIAQSDTEIGTERTNAFGVKFLFTPSDRTSIYLNMNWSTDKDGTFGFGKWNGGDNDADNVNLPSPNTSNCFGPTFSFSIFTTNRSRGYYCGEIGTPDAFFANLGGLNGVTRETFNAGMTAELSVGEWDLASVTGILVYDYENAFGATDNSASASVAWDGRDNNKTLSEEIRLSSPQDRDVRLNVGAYYYKEESGDGFDTSFFPNAGETYLDADLSGSTFTDGSQVRNTAIFGGIDWDLTDSLTLSAELRVQEEEIRLSGANAAGDPQYDGSPSIDFTAVLPRLALSWNVTEAYNVYGSIAQGNNPGDFNSAYYNTTYDAAERAIFLDTRGSYEESKVTTYEIGLKGTFLGGHLGLNTALYMNNWEKQALTNSDALTRVATGTQTTVTYITNAGESEVKGLEIELTARPTDYWDLSLSYALADSEFKDYLDENYRDLLDTNGVYTGLDFTGALIVDDVDPDGQVAGNELPQTPRHMGTLSSTLHWPTANNTEIYVRADLTYESKRYVQAANLAWVGAAENLNLRIGYQTDNWAVSIWGSNLTENDTPEVVTRLVDFRRGLLMPSQIRVSGLRFSFLRDFSVTAPRSRRFGLTFTHDF